MERLHALGCAAVEGQAEEGRFVDAADAVRAAGEVGHVAQQDADDLAEAESHDGQIVTAQAQHREAQQEAEQCCHRAGDGQCSPEPDPVIVREQRVGVGTDGVETDVTQVEQAGQTDDDVQPEAEHHVDQDQRGDVHRAA